MAAANWPGTLPQGLLIDGAIDGMADGRLRTKTDMGPGKVRPRTFAAVRPLSGDIMCTDAQLQALRDFVGTTLAGGSLPFYWVDPVDNSTVLMRFGEQLPKWAAISGDRWRVSLVLEILP